MEWDPFKEYRMKGGHSHCLKIAKIYFLEYVAADLHDASQIKGVGTVTSRCWNFNIPLGGFNILNFFS